MTTTIVLTGGGTGGHVFPALSIAAALREPAVAGPEPVELIYVGLRRGPEARLAPEHGLAFRSVLAGPMRRRNPLSMLWSGVQIAIGTWQAWRILVKAGAKAVLATGGYVTVPVALATRWARVPLVVYLPDVEPGWAVRFTARLARRIATTNDRAAAQLPVGKTVATGYPVRPEFRAATRAEARQRLGVPDDVPLLLITGATQGARAVNEEIARRLSDYLRRRRIVHVTGPAHFERFVAIRDGLSAELGERYRVHAFMDDLPFAMLAADLAVMRAGASVLGELPAARLPAVLVPYPYAGAHQRRNAEQLAELGCAVLLDESEISELYGRVEALLDDADARAEMAKRLEALDRPEAAREIARLVLTEAGAIAASGASAEGSVR